MDQIVAQSAPLIDLGAFVCKEGTEGPTAAHAAHVVLWNGACACPDGCKGCASTCYHTCDEYCDPEECAGIYPLRCECESPTSAWKVIATLNGESDRSRELIANLERLGTLSPRQTLSAVQISQVRFLLRFATGDRQAAQEKFEEIFPSGLAGDPAPLS